MEISLGELQDGVRRASAEIVKVLRTGPDVQALTPGREWTVRETAVHLKRPVMPHSSLATPA